GVVREAGPWLKPGGHLLFEIGADQEEAARQRLRQAPGFEEAATIRDGEGRPRVLRARWRGGGGGRLPRRRRPAPPPGDPRPPTTFPHPPPPPAPPRPP